MPNPKLAARKPEFRRIQPRRNIIPVKLNSDFFLCLPLLNPGSKLFPAPIVTLIAAMGAKSSGAPSKDDSHVLFPDAAAAQGGVIKETWMEEDPREAILKYAEVDVKDPKFIAPAYSQTLPETIFAKSDDQERRLR